MLTQMSILQQHIFRFDADISAMDTPKLVNNPFGLSLPPIAHQAAKEFQKHLVSNYSLWNENLQNKKGKMFGILVVALKNGSLAYIAAASGNIPKYIIDNKLVPSIFDDSVEDYKINKGMTELTHICNKINASSDEQEIITLKEERSQKSFALQRWLFSQYRIQNANMQESNVLEIFRNSSHGNPPAATGECAAPKLLQFAFKHELKPLAIAEFWWGKPPKGDERKHGNFYPACKNKCRPILEYMLGDNRLYQMK